MIELTFCVSVAGILMPEVPTSLSAKTRYCMVLSRGDLLKTDHHSQQRPAIGSVIRIEEFYGEDD